MPTLPERVGPLRDRAIDCFYSQDYEGGRELLMVDTDSPLGVKRNSLIKQAKGDYICHWDDDDWHAPHRLSYEMSRLQEHAVDLVGASEMLAYNPDTGEAWRATAKHRSWPGTWLYTKKLWENIGGFKDEPRCDMFYEIAVRKGHKWQPLDDVTFIVVTLHPGNTGTIFRRPLDTWHVFDPATVLKMMDTKSCTRRAS